MPRLIFIAFIFCTITSYAQTDTTQWLRAFPIADYMVKINDTTTLVQVQLNDGTVLKDKQIGLIRGVYNNSSADTADKGYGRCQLIKGDQYYYFAIAHNTSGKLLQGGDLLYTFVNKPSVYKGRVIKVACHFIGLQNVYEEPLYDRYKIFYLWTEAAETALIDSMKNDVRFTGNYFMQNNPSMDKDITSGKFKGKKVLTVMATCDANDINDFLDYMIARPRLYAGKQWKISEIFATWAVEGAPTVIK